jgi:hypothetical protein
MQIGRHGGNNSPEAVSCHFGPVKKGMKRFVLQNIQLFAKIH